MWQTTVRQYVLEPCLPPPVVRLIRETWDPYLSSILGHDEGTVTLLVQALVLLFSTRLLLLGLRNWQRRATGPSYASATTAIREPQDGGDDDEDDGIVAVDSATRYFSTTAIRLLLLTNKKTSTTTTSTGVVLLCGPPNAGKTTLFTQLLLSSSSTTTTTTSSSSSSSSSPNKKPLLSTVTSLKANVALFGSNKNVCLIDWPGHAAAMAATNGGSFVLTDPTLSQIWSSSSSTTRSSRPLRLVLVLDATQPVQSAAAILYQLWHAAASTSSSTTRRSNPILRIFVACHKSDLPKAKNVKRLQLQLRTELEKLLAVQQPDWWPGKATATYEVTVNDQGCLLPGQVVQWYFSATSSTSLLLLPDDELLQFCQTGQWPVV
ncbi:hypothetical protein ACA910_017293 [Epithemia clementina (nom. ined.)]